MPAPIREVKLAAEDGTTINCRIEPTDNGQFRVWEYSNVGRPVVTGLHDDRREAEAQALDLHDGPFVITEIVR